MNYADAVVYLKENGITKEDGVTFYEFGEVQRFLYISKAQCMRGTLL